MKALLLSLAVLHLGLWLGALAMILTAIGLHSADKLRQAAFSLCLPVLGPSLAMIVHLKDRMTPGQPTKTDITDSGITKAFLLHW